MTCLAWHGLQSAAQQVWIRSAAPVKKLTLQHAAPGLHALCSPVDGNVPLACSRDELAARTPWATCLTHTMATRAACDVAGALGRLVFLLAEQHAESSVCAHVS